MRLIFTFVLLGLFHFQLCAQKKSIQAFVENKGQIVDQNGNVNAKVRFLLSLQGMNVQLHQNGFSYDTYVAEPTINSSEQKVSKFHKMQAKGVQVKEKIQQQFRFHRVDISFEGASANPEILLVDACSDYFNYYNNSQNELIQARRFNKIVYKNLYRGIDMEMVTLNKKGQTFEYNFIVHPGADVNQIQMRYNGATATSLSQNNSILLQTKSGMLEEKIPLSFEQATKKTVQVQYIQTSTNTYGFKAGAYNKNQTLVIDPSPDRVWGTYYGGSGDEYMAFSNTLAVDASENVYMCGNTNSTAGIATTGAYQTTFSGDEDVFIVKFNSAGVRQWCTYFGGILYEEADGITIDGSGNLIVCGYTESTASIATPGTQQTTTDGLGDGFLVKFNSSGARQWGTYYGGAGNIDGFSSVAAFGTDLYAGGATFNSAGISSAGAHQTTFGGFIDGILVKFNSSGIRQWGTYYGGVLDEFVYNVHVDGSENVFITGYSSSTTGIATAGTHQTTLSGTKDGFIAKFNSSGVRQWGTYYGGAAADLLIGVKTDAGGNIYANGVTESTTNIATAGTQQTTYGGGNTDGFVVKMNSGGVRQWGTYVGGSLGDTLFAFHVLTDGTIYTAGYTSSTNNIATAGAYQTTIGGQFDAIVLKYNTSGIRIWGSYYGGSGDDIFSSITVTTGGAIYAGGKTSSSNAIASAGSHQPSISVPGECFMVKFTDVITGVSQLSLENGIQLYPNPVSKELIVTFKNNSSPTFAALYNVEGKLVLQQRINIAANAPLRMNVAGLQSGTYLLKIWNNKDQLISAEQIVVQH